MMNTNNYSISLQHACQAYDGKTILNDINLNISPGEFVTLVGPTGSGKSTLIRLILGSERPSQGVALKYDEEIERPGPDRGIIFQKYSLFPNKTVQENVVFGLELKTFNLFDPWCNPFSLFSYRHKRKEFKKLGEYYLEKVGLLEHANKYPYQLSGGQKQRAAIVQAMIMQPEVMLMDEPFGALDEGTREGIQVFTLEEWKKNKETVIFITHSLEEALFMGTRLIVLSQYYEKQNGEEGAKIVKDIHIPWDHPRSTKIKSSKEFTDLIEEIKYEGLNPNYLQRIADFDLSHKDSNKNII